MTSFDVSSVNFESPLLPDLDDLRAYNGDGSGSFHYETQTTRRPTIEVLDTPAPTPYMAAAAVCQSRPSFAYQHSAPLPALFKVHF